jgi:2-oxo-4-hydroxy-4-carboxy-5-ureidoimidazoline decarboxylase
MFDVIEMRLAELNALPRAAAANKLRRCCGSTRWARLMTEARPFADVGALVTAADAIWASLHPADWLEAFAAHPRIGSGGTGGTSGTGGESAAGWAAQEQSGMADAAAAVRLRLAEANREYEARFGYIFIVCATGRSGQEMLDLLERRLQNESGSELRMAAEEQRKITRLRLMKLLDIAQGPTT